jgi:hypothetical protein
MPLQKLVFRPGVNREGTTLTNEGGWYETDKVRFRSGFPEKIGGWTRDKGTQNNTGTSLQPTTGSFWGICRSMWNWFNLAGYNLLGLGTNLKYYIQNSNGGSFYDITPIRLTTAAGDVTFAATSGSSTLTVTDLAHGAQAGDFVTFTGAASLGGLITAAVLNREYRVVTVLTNNTYTITAFNGVSTVTANASDTGTGGVLTVGAYQLTTGSDIYTVGVGWGAGTWGGVTTITATTTLTSAINSSVTTIPVVSTTGFAASGVIGIDGEYINYTGKTTGPDTFTGCTRGGTGGVSTPAAHSAGAVVQQFSGATGWGSSATTGIGIQLRIWSEHNFGENLIINPRGGSMYFWAVNTNPSLFDRAQYLGPSAVITQKNYATGIGTTTVTVDATCPTFVNQVLVSDSSRFVIAFGCNDPTGAYASTEQDPMQIRWSDQESYSTWTPSITNQAGGFRLSSGSQIITALQTRQEILVWTDAAIYSMQFLGAPYVWGFQIMGDNLSIISPNSAVTVNNITYWMGADKFYMYSGRVETLPCSVRQYIFDDINLEQGYQVFGGSNEGYSEIWWYYCSTSGPNGTGTAAEPNTTVDRYVIYDYLDRTWVYGNLARTAWLDSPLRVSPMATTYGNALVYHEQGNDDGTTEPPSPIYAYVRSSDFDIGDGHNFGLVWRIIPDVTFDGSTSAAPVVNFTVLPRQNPGADYGSSDNPAVVSKRDYSTQRTYNIQTFTQYAYVRIRGRQMAFEVSSDERGVAWQLGAPRLDVRPDGRR